MVLRLTYTLAMVLCLSLPAVGMEVQQQDSANSSNAVGQSPAVPAPVTATPATNNKTDESVAKVKRDADSPNVGSPKTSATNRSAKRRKTTARAPYGPPRKVVVREGGASEPMERIAPGMTPAEALRQRQDAERLLGAADDQLKQLAKSSLAKSSLDARQQEMAGQIRNYMKGARKALQEGDLRRASTLALKANLLAEDLQQH
jgi:hypothetical protein